MLMIEGMVLVFLIDGSAVLGGGKRPPFIPLLSIFFAFANFSTVCHFCRNVTVRITKRTDVGTLTLLLVMLPVYY